MVWRAKGKIEPRGLEAGRKLSDVCGRLPGR